MPYTLPNDWLDRITRMAAQLFKVPSAAVSLTDHDRQWLQSKVEVGHDAITRFQAPCSQVAEQQGALVVPEMLADVVVPKMIHKLTTSMLFGHWK